MKLIILQYVCIIALIGVCYGQFTNQNGQFVANPQQFAGNNQQPGVNNQFQNGQTGLTNQLTNQNFPPSPNAQPGANFPPNQPGTGGFPQNQPGGGFPPTQPGGGFQQNQPGFPQGGQGGGFPGNNQPGGFTGNQPGGGFNQNQQPGFQGNTQPGGFTPNQQPGGFPAPNPQPGAFPAPNPQPGAFPAPNPQPGAFPQGTNTAAFGMGRFQTGGFNTIGNNFGNPFVAGNNFGQNPFRGGAQDNTQFTASGQLFMSLSQNPNNYRYATCYFNSSANAIRGRADFRQFLFGESGVDVRVQVVGLPNSPVDTQRGIHIHEFGDIGENCARVGPHFNPTQTRHGGRNSFPFLRHAGDLGNMLQSPQGVSSTQFRDNVISLQGRNSILGRSLVIKYERDDEGTGTNSASQMNGNARTPLACCTIGRASPANWGAPYTEQELMELAGLPFTNTAPAANANSAGGLQTGANNQGQVGNNNQGFNSNTNNNQGFNNNNQGFNNNNQGFNVNNNNDNNQGFNSNNNNNNNNNDFGFNFMNN